MKKHSDSDRSTFEDLIGLGSHSARKSHYAVLEQNLLALETERNRYKWLFENALHGIFQADIDGNIRTFNPAFSSICGFSDEVDTVLPTLTLQSIFSSEINYQQFSEKLLIDGKVERHPSTFKRADGELIKVSLNALFKKQDGHELFEVFVQDITAFFNAQKQLTALNEELEERVDSRTEDLNALNQKLMSEIFEREKIEHELILAKEVAENANKSKDKYLAAASHDLLQPMNAARLFVSTLLERSMAAKDLYLVERVHLALENAEYLLTDLLYISKLDQNAVKPHHEIFSVQQLLDGLEGEFAPVANETELGLKVRNSDRAILSDINLLRRILSNFLSNALRYTHNGRVMLGCRVKGESLHIQVWDTGIGIAKDYMEEIFEEFKQLDSRQKGSNKGVGLGLAIVERIGRMLLHPITVKSWPGRGSMFCIEVPLADSREIRPAAPLTQISTSNLDNARILVIDNDNDILLSMDVLLRQWGCVTFLASNQQDAIAILETQVVPIDIILADYHLDNDSTGTDAVLALRQHSGLAIPAAIITADHSDESIRLFRKLDLPLLNKPVKPAKLRVLLSFLFSEKTATR